jgi:hypothetical protein
MPDESRKIRGLDGCRGKGVPIPGKRRLDDERANFLGGRADFINDLI